MNITSLFIPFSSFLPYFLLLCSSILNVLFHLKYKQDCITNFCKKNHQEYGLPFCINEHWSIWYSWKSPAPDVFKASLKTNILPHYFSLTTSYHPVRHVTHCSSAYFLSLYIHIYMLCPYILKPWIMAAYNNGKGSKQWYSTGWTELLWSDQTKTNLLGSRSSDRSYHFLW